MYLEADEGLGCCNGDDECEINLDRSCNTHAALINDRQTNYESANLETVASKARRKPIGIKQFVNE